MLPFLFMSPDDVVVQLSGGHEWGVNVMKEQAGESTSQAAVKRRTRRRGRVVSSVSLCGATFAGCMA